MNHDFIALERETWAATAHDAGMHPAPELRWCTDYPRAIERAVMVHDFVPLLRLLDAGEPLHPLLLPALADALRVRANKRSGRKPKLTTIETAMVARSVQALRRGALFVDISGQPVRKARLSVAQAVAEVARDTKLSPSVVKAAYQSHNRRPSTDSR